MTLYCECPLGPVGVDLEHSDACRRCGRPFTLAQRSPVARPELEVAPELYDEEAERSAAWCDRCGAYHDWRRSCE